MEIDDLKKRKNRDLEDIKKLKVELHKMEILYKKYREIATQQAAASMSSPLLAGVANIAEIIPFSLQQPEELAQILSTEELLIETAKIKNLLQREIFHRKRHMAHD